MADEQKQSSEPPKPKSELPTPQKPAGPPNRLIKGSRNKPPKKK